MLAQIVNARPDPARLASVRVWLSSSDHLPSAVRARLLEYGAFVRLPGGRRVEPLLLDAYGMVELGGIAMIGVQSRLMPGGGRWHLPVPPFRVRTLLESGAVGAARPGGRVRGEGARPDDRLLEGPGDDRPADYARRLAADRRPRHPQHVRLRPTGGTVQGRHQVRRLLGLRERRRRRDGCASRRGARRRARRGPCRERGDSRSAWSNCARTPTRRKTS